MALKNKVWGNLFLPLIDLITVGLRSPPWECATMAWYNVTYMNMGVHLVPWDGNGILEHEPTWQKGSQVRISPETLFWPLKKKMRHNEYFWHPMRVGADKNGKTKKLLRHFIITKIERKIKQSPSRMKKWIKKKNKKKSVNGKPFLFFNVNFIGIIWQLSKCND